jgi:hypothetical protein
MCAILDELAVKGMVKETVGFMQDYGFTRSRAGIKDFVRRSPHEFC